MHFDEEEDYWVRADETDSQYESPPPCSYYHTERYAVRRPMYNDIVLRMGVGYPQVDLFADRELHLCDVWCGPGSGFAPDAMAYHWGGGRLHWCNPPYSMLAEVIDKAVRAQAFVIVLVPYWTNQDMFRKAYEVLFH